MAFDADGTALLAAWHNHKIRRFDPATGRVTVVCGARPGFTGDGMPAMGALLNQPKASPSSTTRSDLRRRLAQLQRVRRIDTDGVIEHRGRHRRRSASAATAARRRGAASTCRLATTTREPGGGLAIDAQDRLYIADTENHRIRRVDFATDIIETVAGNGTPGSRATAARPRTRRSTCPRDVALGPDGRLYIADTDNHRVRVVDLATGIITHLRGQRRRGLRGRRRPADRGVAAAAVGHHVRRRRQPLHRRHAQQPHPEGVAVTGPARLRARGLGRRLAGAAAAAGCGDETQPPPAPPSPAIRRPG